MVSDSKSSPTIVHTPPTAPAKESENPPRRPELTKDQFSKLSALISHLNGPDFALPCTVKDVKAAQKARLKRHGAKPELWTGLSLASGNKDEVMRPLSDTEKCFLSNEQCQRFLRAVKWDLPAAFSRTEETVVWRREFEVEKINENPDMIEEEGRTGKEVIMGWDLQRRPCLYMFPYRQNTNTLDRQIQFVVWCLERTVDMMGPEVENLCLLIDFGTGEKGGGGQPTSLGQARKVLSILQTYYCERLGRALCIRIPSIFYGFYRLVSPFVDPVTKDKIRFNPDCRTLVPPSQLDKLAFGGDFHFEYKHDQYFPFMHEVAKKRREDNLARWRQFGGNKCGLSEFIIKGGMDNERTSEDVEREQVAAGSAKSGGDSATNGSTLDPSSNGAAGAAAPIGSSDRTVASSSKAAASGQASSLDASASGGALSQAADGQHTGRRDQENGTAESGALDIATVNGSDRPRANSTESFVTSRETISPPLVDADRLDASLKSSEMNGEKGGLGVETGIAGLVIKEDGSLGAP